MFINPLFFFLYGIIKGFLSIFTDFPSKVNLQNWYTEVFFLAFHLLFKWKEIRCSKFLDAFLLKHVTLLLIHIKNHILFFVLSTAFCGC